MPAHNTTLIQLQAPRTELNPRCDLRCGATIPHVRYCLLWAQCIPDEWWLTHGLVESDTMHPRSSDDFAAPVRSLGRWIRLLPSIFVSRSDLKVFQDGCSANAMLSLADVDKPCLYPCILLISLDPFAARGPDVYYVFWAEIECSTSVIRRETSAIRRC
jgi:hypothetical protein